jgi:hypothetical protein
MKGILTTILEPMGNISEDIGKKQVEEICFLFDNFGHQRRIVVANCREK